MAWHTNLTRVLGIKWTRINALSLAIIPRHEYCLWISWIPNKSYDDVTGKAKTWTRPNRNQIYTQNKQDILEYEATIQLLLPFQLNIVAEFASLWLSVLSSVTIIIHTQSTYSELRRSVHLHSKRAGKTSSVSVYSS